MTVHDTVGGGGGEKERGRKESRGQKRIFSKSPTTTYYVYVQP